MRRIGGVGLVLGAALSLVLGACYGSQDTSVFHGLEMSESFVSGSRGASLADQPPARVIGQVVSWDDLAPLLAEARGGLILEEIVLDRMLRRELDLAGIELTDAARMAERDRLLETLAMTGTDSTSRQLALLERLRRDRGLGDRRLGLLLDRNAMLRLLVRDQIEVTPGDIRLAYEIIHGERFTVRLILTDARQQAQDARRRVLAIEGDVDIAFAAVAVERSGHASAGRGGLIGPISPADPSHPEAIRRSLVALEPGMPSPVVSVPSGFAVLLLHERLARTGVPIESVAPSLRDQIQQRKERLAMETLADQLLRDANVTVYDPSLRWSWQQRRGEP